MLNNKGEIFLNANDIFNTNKIQETIHAADVTMHAEDFTMIRKDYLETQIIMGGFKYKF